MGTIIILVIIVVAFLVWNRYPFVDVDPIEREKAKVEISKINRSSQTMGG